jgi:hypothetical protein
MPGVRPRGSTTRLHRDRTISPQPAPAATIPTPPENSVPQTDSVPPPAPPVPAPQPAPISSLAKPESSFSCLSRTLCLHLPCRPSPVAQAFLPVRFPGRITTSQHLMQRRRPAGVFFRALNHQFAWDRYVPRSNIRRGGFRTHPSVPSHPRSGIRFLGKSVVGATGSVALPVTSPQATIYRNARTISRFKNFVGAGFKPAPTLVKR